MTRPFGCPGFYVLDTWVIPGLHFHRWRGYGHPSVGLWVPHRCMAELPVVQPAVWVATWGRTPTRSAGVAGAGSSRASTERRECGQKATQAYDGIEEGRLLSVPRCNTGGPEVL